MERVKNIESLSLMFTAGVVAGTVFFPGAGIWLPALLLPLASLPILAKERLLRMKESASLPLLLGSFVLRPHRRPPLGGHPQPPGTTGRFRRREPPRPHPLAPLLLRGHRPPP